MVELILGIAVLLIIVGYFVGWIVCLFHFHAKFQHCAQLWEVANKEGDKNARAIYWKAEILAHSDTGMAILWPLVIHRWNVNYITEARNS